MNTKIIIICPIHGEFEQTPWNHIKIGCGCQKCSHCGYSKAQILWLNFIATYYNIHISHAENAFTVCKKDCKCISGSFGVYCVLSRYLGSAMSMMSICFLR